MDIHSLTSGAALSQYATSLLARQQSAKGDAASTADALTAKLTAAPTHFKSTQAQHALDKQQAALGKELASGLAKAGLKLGAHVSLSVGKDGKVAVEGSDADQAAVQKYLKADTSHPSLASRLGAAEQRDLARRALRRSGEQRDGDVLAVHGPRRHVGGRHELRRAGEHGELSWVHQLACVKVTGLRPVTALRREPADTR